MNKSSNKCVDSNASYNHTRMQNSRGDDSNCCAMMEDFQRDKVSNHNPRSVNGNDISFAFNDTKHRPSPHDCGSERYLPPPTVSATATSNVRRFACSARNLKGHNQLTAHLEVPLDASHGLILKCSHPLCAASERRFRWCEHCQKPVAKRNFARRHDHGLLIHDGGRIFFPSDVMAYFKKKNETTVMKAKPPSIQERTTPIHSPSILPSSCQVISSRTQKTSLMANVIVLKCPQLLHQSAAHPQVGPAYSPSQQSNLVTRMGFASKLETTGRLMSFISPSSPTREFNRRDNDVARNVDRGPVGSEIATGDHTTQRLPSQDRPKTHQCFLPQGTSMNRDKGRNNCIMSTFGNEDTDELDEVLGDFDQELGDYHGSWQLAPDDDV